MDVVVTLWLASVAFVNDTSKELTKGNSPPVVDRELTAPPFIVATVVIVNKVETSRKKLRIGRAILPVN